MPDLSLSLLENLLVRLQRNKVQNMSKIKIVKELIYSKIYMGAGAGFSEKEIHEKEKIVLSFLNV